VRQVLRSWGPGKFDAQLSFDGKAFRPDGKSAATLIPAAFGMGGVNLHTYTGWGSVSHWNALVAVLEMHGKGTFYDPRLNNKEQFPVAARAGFGNVRSDEDLVTPKLAALQMYQLALVVPKPKFNPFNFAAIRGKTVFETKAQCTQCHVPPIYTEPGWNMHTPAEICVDSFQADRSPDRAYRTTPLGGLQAREKGGFYHDGRFKTLGEVVDHYNSCKALGLLDGERNDLVEYLKTF
jgi:cytochrome c peroxidase